ncbi:hypothetical protein BCR36DRAFT_246816, partial [Piromyces finnis]
GPQQKRKKRKYKKREKPDKNENESDEMEESNINEHNNNYNYSVIESIISRNLDCLYDVKMTQNTFDDYIDYNESINYKDKLVVNENQNIGSELINYVVINCYYKYFHPNFPVVNYNYFAVHAKNGTLSKYLLFSMYGMAYLYQSNANMSKASEYIEKAKALILQNYTNVNAQLLQAIYLVTVFESGNNQAWVFSGIGIKIIKTHLLYLMNVKKNKYLFKEDIENMRSISLIILSYDTWLVLTYKDGMPPLQLKEFIKSRSDLLISLMQKELTSNYEYHLLCCSIFLLEIVHILNKIKFNDFDIEDIDCINIDILKAQHFFLKNINEVTLIRFNDISEDFSYYLELSELNNGKRKKKNSMKRNSNSSSYNKKQTQNEKLNNTNLSDNLIINENN